MGGPEQKPNNDIEIMQILKQIQVLNRLQSQQHFESAIFMQRIRELTEKLKMLREESEIKQLKDNKKLQSIRRTIAVIEKGPNRMDEMQKELFRNLIEKIELTEDRKVLFYLISGFIFEEKVET